LIVNARMYGVSPEVSRCWRLLLESVASGAGLADAGAALEWLEHPAPAPLEELWARPDMGAVFMCGLPFSRTVPQPVLVAAPVPSPPAFGGEARYWSEFVVRADSAFHSVDDTFGARIAFTVPGSQSGCIAALEYFQTFDTRTALFAEIIAPTITPLGALDAVICGAAEIAPIDSYALALLRAHRPDLTARVRVVGRTAPTPIPPLVASSGGHVEALSLALLAAHTDETLQPLLEPLQLQRFTRPQPAAYEALAAGFAATTQFWRAHRLAAVAHPAFVW
jgi:ABC-type phosphate/phosphonate transport system substrate-binding protein